MRSEATVAEYSFTGIETRPKERLKEAIERDWVAMREGSLVCGVTRHSVAHLEVARRRTSTIAAFHLTAGPGRAPSYRGGLRASAISPERRPARPGFPPETTHETRVRTAIPCDRHCRTAFCAHGCRKVGP